MTHASIVFRMSDLATGHALAEAIVCAPVRYAAIRYPGGGRLSHNHAPAATWKQIDSDLSLGLPNGPLDKSCALAKLLVPEERRDSVVLQYVVGLPVEAEPALTIAERLDAALATIVPAWIALPTGPQLVDRPAQPK